MKIKFTKLVITVSIAGAAISAYALGCGQQAASSESQGGCPDCSQDYYLKADGSAFNATCKSGDSNDNCHKSGIQVTYYKKTVKGTCYAAQPGVPEHCGPTTAPTTITDAVERNDQETFTGTCAG